MSVLHKFNPENCWAAKMAPLPAKDDLGFVAEQPAKKTASNVVNSMILESTDFFTGNPFQWDSLFICYIAGQSLTCLSEI